MATKVTDEGQVTIPKWVQDQVGGPGSEVDFRRAADGSVVLEKAEAAAPLDPDRFPRLRGSAGPGPSIDADRTQPIRFDKVVGILGPSPSTDEIMELLRGEPE